jgi:hypothetical protein
MSQISQIELSQIEQRVAARAAASSWRRQTAVLQALERARELVSAPPGRAWPLGRLREAWVVYRFGTSIRDEWLTPDSGRSALATTVPATPGRAAAAKSVAPQSDRAVRAARRPPPARLAARRRRGALRPRRPGSRGHPGGPHRPPARARQGHARRDPSPHALASRARQVRYADELRHGRWELASASRGGGSSVRPSVRRKGASWNTSSMRTRPTISRSQRRRTGRLRPATPALGESEG